jgi:tyrosyl-tRNA synthetase
MSAFEALAERGFVKQCTDEGALKALLDKETVTFYAGFDPTADSLHAGSLVPIMAMAHLQRAGHQPIAIIGGGTTMIGDPSGKTEMRKLMSQETIEQNGQGILGQLQRYLNLDGEQGLFLNNADWLLQLNYIEFLRDIGRHFRVNEMIRMDAYRQRLEREEGLSFIEFNYQLLQAYDFLLLNQRHSCRLQIGGDDQWGNILAGSDLIRRVERNSAFGLTFPLLTTARGQKMGKTEKGAIWLSSDRTSPYEFYQYWINTDDRDVERFLKYFTFLPLDEIGRLSALEGADIRQAKERLAFEATTLCHGEQEAENARQASIAAFSNNAADMSSIPTSNISAARVAEGILLVDLFVEVGLAESKSSIRRLIAQGGAYINDTKITEPNATISTTDVTDGALLLRHGKKKHHRVLVE